MTETDDSDGDLKWVEYGVGWKVVEYRIYRRATNLWFFDWCDGFVKNHVIVSEVILSCHILLEYNEILHLVRIAFCEFSFSRKIIEPGVDLKYLIMWHMPRMEEQLTAFFLTTLHSFENLLFQLIFTYFDSLLLFSGL